MTMFRTISRSRRSTDSPAILLLALLLVVTSLVSGCAAVVSSRPTPETTPPPPAPLSITANSLPAATAQTAYSATLSATGATAPYKWSMTSGSLPPSLAMSAAGQISGMPTQAGSFSFTVQVTDSSTPPQSATANFGLTVKAAAVAPLQISTSSLAAGQMNSAYTTTLSGTGGTPAYSWTLLSGQLPPGLTLNASSGAIAGTPSQAGSYSFTVKLTDSGNPVQSDVANLSINITAVNPALQVTTTTLPAGETGSAYSATLAATGGVAPYSWSLSGGTLPSGLTLSAAGLISGTPTQASNPSITVQVKDSASPAATATKTLSLSVVLTGGPLQITTASLPNGQANVAYSTTVTAIGGTKPYVWSISAGSLPSGLTLNSSSGVISGTPTQSGAFSLTIQAKDSAIAPQTATTALSLNVAVAVTPVQITTASLSGGQANSAYGATLSASGGTTPYAWSITTGTLPTGLTLNGSTGQIGGTPTQAGTSSFTVQVKDSTSPAQTATKALSITITAVVPPVQITTSTLVGGQVSTAYSASLAASGGTTPYSWSLSAGSLPAGLSLSAAGQITGTPTASGTSNFTVRVADSTSPAKTATANLSIAIAAVVVPVSISTTSLPGGTVSSAYSATLAATGGKTPYSWSLSAGSLPAGLTLSGGGVISGTPTASGTVSFTVRVADSSAPATTATANLSIAVAAVVTPPVTISTTSLPGGTVSSAYSSTLAATGGKTPYSWSLSAGSLPAGLTLSGGGVISGTPTASGTVSFTVRVADSSAPAKTATANLSIAVAAATTPPVTITTASLPSGTVSTAYSSTLVATGGTTPYSWSLSAGSLPAGLTINSGGVISGTPTASGTVSFTVRVSDSSAPAKTATANLSIAVASGVTPLAITTSSLPDGQVSSSYSKGLTATGGTTPYTWSITAGSLPAGLSLAPSTGQITGTPTATGTSSFTVSVKDSSAPQQTDTQVLSIFVSSAVTGTSVTACGTLSNSGSTYTLQNDVSASGTCFTVSANNITFNLNGHTVTYNTGDQGNAHAISVTTGNSQGFAVSNGTLTESSGATASGAHVINMGVVVSGPTIHDITFNWSSGFSQAINTDYGNSSVTNGAMIYNNTLNNNNSAGSCGQVSCRDLLQSASIRLSNAIRSSTPPQIFNNTINGGPQGALECDAPGCIIHDNIINPGNAAVENTNDFAIWCWASCNAYNNTIMTPLTGNSEGRGIQLSGVETSTNGANVHNNTVTVTAKPNNAEYGGCELGGTYGIQFDDNGKGGTAQNNDVTAVADQCWATALRLTDTETTSNVSQNNTYKAIRKSSGSQACNYIGGSEKTGCAHAIALASPTGFLSKNDTFQGDSDILFLDWDGGSGVTFVSPTFLKGTTNPSPNFHTFVFRNGGTVVSNVHVQDATFGSGTGATDTDLPAKGGNNQAASVFIDWSQTITVNKSGGGAAAGATVSFTDAQGKTYTGTADGSGVAVVVVPQYRLNNDSGANGIENHNPFNRSVSSSGCSTNTTTGLSISGTGSATVTLGGC